MSDDRAAGAVAAIIVLVFLVPLLAVIGALTGAFGGWIVGLFYRDTLAAAAAAFHIGPLEPWQLGMFLGFVGGFLRASITTKGS